MSKVKFNIARAKQEIALPLRVVWDRKWKGMWAFVVQLFVWGLVVSSTSPKPVERIENVQTKDVPNDAPKIRPTKAYADGRQKKRRRRRKRVTV